MSNVRHGMIVREQSGFYWVEVPSEANKVYRCRLRGKLMETAQTADIAAIGDQVELLVSENEDLDHIGTITHVHERQHVLSRSVRTSGLRGGGSPERQQIIIANVSQTSMKSFTCTPLIDNAISFSDSLPLNGCILST